MRGGRGPAAVRGQWQSGNAQVIRAQAFYCLVGNTGMAGLIALGPARFTRYFAAAVLGTGSRMRAACGTGRGSMRHDFVIAWRGCAPGRAGVGA